MACPFQCVNFQEGCSFVARDIDLQKKPKKYTDSAVARSEMCALENVRESKLPKFDLGSVEEDLSIHQNPFAIANKEELNDEESKEGVSRLDYLRPVMQALFLRDDQLKQRNGTIYRIREKNRRQTVQRPNNRTLTIIRDSNRHSI